MGDGPGKGGGTDLAEETDNSEDTTERLATDSGSGILLAILVVEIDRVVSPGELIVGEGDWAKDREGTLGVLNAHQPHLVCLPIPQLCAPQHI
jgi:hypothetical protein